ncbi:DUF4123 domain-containing protein [Pseudomonas syringae]|nr:DUF4123 domain-containing protein [Pseudomonas syringae]MBD8793396.1 DUF4123 domain-containing protein [Pseudomonas syringae]MBD8803998.1 DUF4123 domain-containing protein [Pseudomonas syringae]MBD8812598.1 DUF4123 domain-containing protein [Pseudomonas syringae]
MTLPLEHRLIIESPYALLNPLWVEKELWQDLPHMALKPTRLDADAGLLPVMLILDELSLTQRLALIKRVQRWQVSNDYPFFCALIESTKPAEQVARHFNRQLLLRRPGEQFSVLRFHDPRVFEHLRWILMPTQLATLMGAADAWYWQDTDGQWQCEIRPELKTLTMVLFQHQLDTLGRLGVLNRILDHLRLEALSTRFDMDVVRQLDAVLSRAYNHEGLREDADVQLYACQAVTLHRDIHQHPLLIDALNQVRAGHCTYESACRKVDHQELQAWIHRDAVIRKETP